MDIKVPLDVYIETLRAARECDRGRPRLNQFEWLLRNFRISDDSAVYEPEEPEHYQVPSGIQTSTRKSGKMRQDMPRCSSQSALSFKHGSTLLLLHLCTLPSQSVNLFLLFWS